MDLLLKHLVLSFSLSARVLTLATRPLLFSKMPYLLVNVWFWMSESSWLLKIVAICK